MTIILLLYFQSSNQLSESNCGKLMEYINSKLFSFPNIIKSNNGNGGKKFVEVLLNSWRPE